MLARLLRHTENPERTIATAARLCYAPVGAQELFEKMSEEEVEKLLKVILSSGHLSAVEHASFTFAIEGISRACSHQLVRHRLASYNQQSQRYVKYQEELDFVVPPEIEKDPKLKQRFEEVLDSSYKVYQDLLSSGVEAEDARYILPQATGTKIVMTMNARELLHFFTLRTCERAQWEIRYLAEEMLSQVYKIAPKLFAKAGPACIRTRCPEGKFYCGRPRELTTEGFLRVVTEKSKVERRAPKSLKTKI